MNAPITAESIRAKRAVAADLLSVVSYLPKSEALAALKGRAVLDHVAYPQYAGHWDGYVLGRVTRTVKTKGGVAFEKGDLCIYKAADPGYVCVYSHRNGIDTSVRASHVEAVPVG